MKKIIALLIISVFLVSCTDNTEKTIVETETPNIEIEENINETAEKALESIENEIAEEQDIKEVNETHIEPETVTKTTTDEAILESEVNDLLDEFIDSLDSYDK